jgi:hypothetical protein
VVGGGRGGGERELDEKEKGEKKFNLHLLFLLTNQGKIAYHYLN